MRVRRLATIWLYVLVGVLMFSSVPAQATKVIHKFESQIGEIPERVGVPAPGKLGEVGSMTDAAGDLYVAENGRVDEFNASTGAFLAQLLDPGPLSGLDRGVGFDDSTGEPLMYLGVEGPVPGVGVFTAGPCGSLECAEPLGEEWTGVGTPNESFVSEKGEGEGRLVNVAVDDSTKIDDWAKGDVFVATATTVSGQFPNLNAVDVFNPEVTQKGSEPPKVVTQILGTPIGEAIGSTEESEPFEKPTALAVSGYNGDVIVIDERASGSLVDLFEPIGFGQYAFAGRLTPPESLLLKERREFFDVAVDGGNDSSSADGDIYVSETITVTGGQRSVVFEFSPAGEFLGELAGQERSIEDGEETEESVARSFQRVEALAVDSVSHRLYVANYRDREGEEPHVGTVEVFGANEVLPEVASGAPGSPELEKGLHTWRVELKGSVNPENGGAATCSFVWGTSPAFGHVTPCVGVGESEKDPVPNGTGPVAVHASIGSLEPGTRYYYRVQASNEQGANAGEEPQDMSFLTPGPGLLSESVSEVSSTSATLGAAIDPDGKATSYRFEYDTQAYGTGEAPHGTSIPAANAALGSGSKEVTVAQHVQDLALHTIYHYRVVALAELAPGVFEEFYGADRSFATQSGGASLALLDGRAWELVSPAEKHGALIFGLEPPFSAPVQASLDGRAVTYAAFTPTESEPAGYSTVEQVVSQRGAGATGWASRDISPPHSEPTGLDLSAEYQVFSRDLSSGVLDLSGGSEASLSPQASERTPYEAEIACEPSAVESECYTPLVSGEEGEDKDVPSGTVFGGNVWPVGTSPDAQHVVLRTNAQLTETSTEGNTELYEWSASEPGSERLQLVSLLPESEGGVPFSGAVIDLGGVPKETISSGTNPVSTDGSRIFWSGDGALYMRDTVRGETVRLDVGQPGVTGGTAEPLFETASVDGSKAFFTDAQRLTKTSSKKGADLYECEFVLSGGRDSCALRDLTPEGTGGPSEVQNLVLGASEEGSYVYFVANGVLGSHTPSTVRHGTCRPPFQASEVCNLYVSHDDEVTFIVALSGEDELDWAGANPTIGDLTARVSADGRFVAFTSVQSLTGYDNRDVLSGMPDAEVFEYDAQTASLVCASCDPSGARPAGRKVSVFSPLTPGATDIAAVPPYNTTGAYHPNSWVAANLPTGVALGIYRESLYLPRLLSDGGRLFFDSSDALVPLDTNGQEDVYEFEPVEVGSCSAGVAGFQEKSDGCVSLVSSGTSSEEAGFLDASGDGDDVFFLTAESLVPEDRDMALDVYDARVCSSSEPCGGGAVSQPACVTVDACRAAPMAQPAVFGAPASATFAGAGNLAAAPAVVAARSLTRAQKLALALRACRKEHAKSKRRRAVCERQERRRYRAVSKARRVKASGRAGR
jgi:hypothetical protein